MTAILNLCERYVAKHAHGMVGPVEGKQETNIQVLAFNSNIHSLR